MIVLTESAIRPLMIELGWMKPAEAVVGVLADLELTLDVSAD